MIQSRLSIGVVPALNTLLPYFNLINIHKKDYNLVYGNVAEINQRMSRKEVDISVISSFAYAKKPLHYYILPDLSISSNGKVGSVYLFSHCPYEKLFKKTIKLSKQSETSVNLIQYLLEEQENRFTYSNEEISDAEVLIADEAIQMYYKKSYPYAYDLGLLWKEKTNLPFVFALWVVQRSTWEKYPKKVIKAWQRLKVPLEDKETVFHSLVAKYSQGLFPSEKACYEYLNKLVFSLEKKYQEGFMRFQKEMKRLEKLDAVAPLNFLPIP